MTGFSLVVDKNGDPSVFSPPLSFRQNYLFTMSSSASSSASCEACGWAAAFCSMLAFGSFGVPIKSGAALSVDIDPLVMQSYKTFMCFITSWLVLAAGEEFHFTPWGIVSGEFLIVVVSKRRGKANYTTDDSQTRGCFLLLLLNTQASFGYPAVWQPFMP